MRTTLNLELGQYGVNCINKCVADHISILGLWREEEGKEEGGKELYVNFV